MNSLTIAIIGAGPSGLVCAKSMSQINPNATVIVFEQSDKVGGLWNYTEQINVHSSAYQGLITNTHRDTTSFKDYPMNQKEYPNYPSHTQMVKYLNAYCDHFNLREKILFNSKVISVTLENGLWRIKVEGQKDYFVNYVAVCNGHHFEPKMPTESEIKGLSSFTGKQIHSHNYRTPFFCKNKRVIVAGLGISGGEIYREVCEVTPQVIGSSHRSYASRDLEPVSFFQSFANMFLNKIHTVESPEQRPEITEINGDTVTFADGSKFTADIIIWCSGYVYSFPFLPQDLIQVESNPSRVYLYKHVFLPSLQNIAFIGLPTVHGSLHPISEAQSEWFAHLIAGDCPLPTKSEMEKDIEDHKEYLRKYNVKYRPLQVSNNQYIDMLKKLMNNKT